MNEQEQRVAYLLLFGAVTVIVVVTVVTAALALQNSRPPLPF